MMDDATLPDAQPGAVAPADSPARRLTRRPGPRWLLAAALAAGGTTAAGAAELHEETIAAWNAYIEATERRIAGELAADGRFLVLDFADEPAAARRAVLAGEVPIEKVETRAGDGGRIRIPKGTIHHWRGGVLIPDVTLADVLHSLIFDVEPTELQGDVAESRLIERDGDRLHVFLRLERREVVTADYNTEHRIAYTRHRPDAASSRSIAVRIAELEDAGSPDEREKPIGRDRGFLWRLRTYWRYQQVDEGVIAECETISLSRGIPRLLGWMVRPIANRAVRGVLHETLTSMSRVLREAAAFEDAGTRVVGEP